MMESSERETTLSESTDDSSTDDESNKYVPQSVYIRDVYIIITIKQSYVYVLHTRKMFFFLYVNWLLL